MMKLSLVVVILFAPMIAFAEDAKSPAINSPTTKCTTGSCDKSETKTGGEVDPQSQEKMHKVIKEAPAKKSNIIHGKPEKIIGGSSAKDKLSPGSPPPVPTRH